MASGANAGDSGRSKPLRVLIADDQAMFGEALQRVLQSRGIEVVGVVTNSADALEVAGREKPDLILVDYVLPDLDGIELARRLIAISPVVKILMVSACDDRETADRALGAGLHGYVTKGADFNNLLDSIDAVGRGGAHPVRGISSGSGVQRSPIDLLAAHLTPRERDVLALLVEGASSKEMARRLSLRANTVRTHVQNVLTKLQVHSRLEAASCAIRHGLVERGAPPPMNKGVPV